MRETRRHPHSLPGISLPAGIQIEDEASFSVRADDVLVVAIPVQQLRGALARWGGLPRSIPIVSVAKGLELDSLHRPSQVIADVLGNAYPVAVLSGPNLAGEIARGLPATTLVASGEPGLAARLVPLFHSTRFRVYHGCDVVGVEMAGALKNIVAIGAGMAEGLGAGDNAKAAFITRGLAEITRLGVACGADPLTFAGISGMGDLIATCASPLSRNHRVGVALAAGIDLATVTRQLGEVAEGVPTTQAAWQLARQLGVGAPIVEQMHRVLFDGAPVEDAIASLLARDPTGER